MRRNQLLTIAWVLIWVGVILLVACWLTRVWFQMTIPFAPTCIVTIVVGALLFLIGRRLN